MAMLGVTGCARRYAVQGLVIQVNPAHREMVVSHRPIKNYMPAMAMPFRVAQKEPFDKLTPGTLVNFELRVGRHDSIARKVRLLETRLDDIDGTPIRVDTPPNKVAVGSPVPDFALTDSSGRTLRLSDFHGRVVAIDFIYTRCPLPNVCPRLSANFAYLSKRMRGRDVTLLSITIDPQYDTPDVLTEYARRWQADGKMWHFLTGTGEQIRSAAGMFGLVYWPEEGSITHTVTTAVVGRDGRLAALVDGSSYRAEQLRDLVEHALAIGASAR